MRINYFLAIITSMPQALNLPPQSAVSSYPPDNFKMDDLSPTSSQALNTLYASFKSFFEVLRNPDNLSPSLLRQALTQKIHSSWQLLSFGTSDYDVFFYNKKIKAVANLSFKTNTWENQSVDPDLRNQVYYQFCVFAAPLDELDFELNINTPYSELKSYFLHAYPSILLNPQYFTIDKYSAPELLHSLESQALHHAQANKLQNDYISGKQIGRAKISLIKTIIQNKLPSRLDCYAQELGFFASLFGLDFNALRPLLTPSPTSSDLIKKSLFTEQLIGSLYFCQDNIGRVGTRKSIYWDSIASKSLSSIGEYTVYQTNSYGLLVKKQSPMSWKGYGFSWLSLYDAPQTLMPYLEYLTSYQPGLEDTMLSFEIRDGELIFADKIFQECMETLFDAITELSEKLTGQQLTLKEKQQMPWLSYEEVLTWKQKQDLEGTLPLLSSVDFISQKNKL